MNNGVTTPILVNYDKHSKKFIYLQFAGDGSVYLFLPRKKGYRVSGHADLDSLLPGENKITLKTNNETSSSPYITYHPAKNSIHINFQKGGSYKLDTPVLKLTDDGTNCFPLCQIIVPEFSHLDDITHNKYGKPFIMNATSANPDKALSLEVFIHPVGTYIATEDLPLHEIRVAQTRIVGAARFESAKLSSVTATLVITEIDKEQTPEGKLGTIVAVFNDAKPYTFKLEPL